MFDRSRIGVRLSPNGGYNGVGCGTNYVDFQYYLQQLDAAGVGYVHVIDEIDIAYFGFHDQCPQFTLKVKCKID